MIKTQAINFPASAILEVAEIIDQLELPVRFMGTSGDFDDGILIHVDFYPAKASTLNRLNALVRERWIEIEEQNEYDEEE